MAVRLTTLASAFFYTILPKITFPCSFTRKDSPYSTLLEVSPFQKKKKKHPTKDKHFLSSRLEMHELCLFGKYAYILGNNFNTYNLITFFRSHLSFI